MDRKTAPPIKDAVEFNLQLKPCEQFTLDNGVPVYAIDAGAQDVLQLELGFMRATGSKISVPWPPPPISCSRTEQVNEPPSS